MKKTLLITGVSGFIGFNLAKKIMNKYQIIGLDNINEYYDINLKKARLKLLQENENFKFFKCDISNKEQLNEIFKHEHEMPNPVECTHPRTYQQRIYQPDTLDGK